MGIIKEYLIKDIEKLNNDEISKLYKYVRTHLIANIPNLKDPLECYNSVHYKGKDLENETTN